MLLCSVILLECLLLLSALVCILFWGQAFSHMRVLSLWPTMCFHIIITIITTNNYWLLKSISINIISWSKHPLCIFTSISHTKEKGLRIIHAFKITQVINGRNKIQTHVWNETCDLQTTEPHRRGLCIFFRLTYLT